MPIPDHVHAIRVETEKYVPDKEDRVWRYYAIQIRFAELYAKLRSDNFLASPDGVVFIITKVMSVEHTSVPQLLGTDRSPRDVLRATEASSSKPIEGDPIWSHFAVKDCSPW